MTEHLDNWGAHVGGPHRDHAIGVAQLHDGVPGVLPQHVAGPHARAVLCHYRASACVLQLENADRSCSGMEACCGDRVATGRPVAAGIWVAWLPFKCQFWDEPGLAMTQNQARSQQGIQSLSSLSSWAHAGTECSSRPAMYLLLCELENDTGAQALYGLCPPTCHTKPKDAGQTWEEHLVSEDATLANRGQQEVVRQEVQPPDPYMILRLHRGSASI